MVLGRAPCCEGRLGNTLRAGPYYPCLAIQRPKHALGSWGGAAELWVCLVIGLSLVWLEF